MKKVLWLLLLTLLLALALAVTPSVSAQANFEISDLTITPESVKEGEPVTISCMVTNTGDAEGTYTLELKINDEVKDTETVEDLEPEGSQTVSFTVTGDIAGDYIVDLNGLPGYFSVTKSFWAMFDPWLWAIIGAIIGVLVLFIIVLVATAPGKKQPGAVTKTKRAGRQGPLATPTPMPMPGPTVTPTAPPTPMPTPTPTPPAAPYAPPAIPTPAPLAPPHAAPTARAIFSVSNLAITPNQVKEGEPITISVIVANNGAEAGKYSLVLRINGVVENITELALAPGVSQAATFTVVKDAGGDYYVEVDGLSGMFTIIPLIPAHFSVSNLGITPDRVKQGESVTISAVVTNTGEVPGSYSVVLKVKGAVESIEEVSLAPGGSQGVSFSVIKDTPGFYQVDLEGLTGRFVVEMEWRG